jgi:molybdopterin-biosynthesis enzyme MoeA-like protein
VLDTFVICWAHAGKINELNVKQAELPDNCELLHNPAGTAQGMWFEKNGKPYISLPGVPFEMKAIYRDVLEQKLKQRFNLPQIRHLTVLTQGVPETRMATMIRDWEAGLPPVLKLAYLPSPGILRRRLTEISPAEQGNSVMSWKMRLKNWKPSSENIFLDTTMTAWKL